MALDCPSCGAEGIGSAALFESSSTLSYWVAKPPAGSWTDGRLAESPVLGLLESPVAACPACNGFFRMTKSGILGLPDRAAGGANENPNAVEKPMTPGEEFALNSLGDSYRPIKDVLARARQESSAVAGAVGPGHEFCLRMLSWRIASDVWRWDSVFWWWVQEWVTPTTAPDAPIVNLTPSMRRALYLASRSLVWWGQQGWLEMEDPRTRQRPHAAMAILQWEYTREDGAPSGCVRRTKPIALKDLSELTAERVARRNEVLELLKTRWPIATDRSFSPWWTENLTALARMLVERSTAGLSWDGLGHEETFALFERSDTRAAGNYLNRLHVAIGELRPEEVRLLAAEALRQLGRGEEALAQLGPAPYTVRYGSHRHRARVIADLAKQSYTHVWYVAGDEDYSPEEMAERIQAGRVAAEKDRNKRVSEWRRMRSEYPASIAAKQRERESQERVAQYQKQFDEGEGISGIAIEEQVSRGIVCPRCHFRYAWDGERCHHCRHSSRNESVPPPASSISPMLLWWPSDRPNSFVD